MHKNTSAGGGRLHVPGLNHAPIGEPFFADGITTVIQAALKDFQRFMEPQPGGNPVPTNVRSADSCRSPQIIWGCRLHNWYVIRLLCVSRDGRCLRLFWALGFPTTPFCIITLNLYWIFTGGWDFPLFWRNVVAWFLKASFVSIWINIHCFNMR